MTEPGALKNHKLILDCVTQLECELDSCARPANNGMARDGTSADLAALNSLLHQFDEIEPLHAISTHGTHLPTVSCLASPAICQNLTGKGIGTLISSQAPAGPQDLVDAVKNTGGAVQNTVLVPPQRLADLCQWYRFNLPGPAVLYRNQQGGTVKVARSCIRPQTVAS